MHNKSTDYNLKKLIKTLFNTLSHKQKVNFGVKEFAEVLTILEGI